MKAAVTWGVLVKMESPTNKNTPSHSIHTSREHNIDTWQTVKKTAVEGVEEVCRYIIRLLLKARSGLSLKSDVY